MTTHENTWRQLKSMSLSEKVNLQRLHTVGFQLYDMLEKAITIQTVKTSVAKGWWVR